MIEQFWQSLMCTAASIGEAQSPPPEAACGAMKLLAVCVNSMPCTDTLLSPPEMCKIVIT